MMRFPNHIRKVPRAKLPNQASVSSVPLPSHGVAPSFIASRLRSSTASRSFSKISYQSCSDEDQFSLHQGLRVQSALVCNRLPTTFVEPEYRQNWREFAAKWAEKTNTETMLDDQITYMRFPFHFLETEDDIRKAKEKEAAGKSTSASTSGFELGGSGFGSNDPNRSDLQKMFSETGLDFDMSSFRKKGGTGKKREKEADLRAVDDSLQSVEKLREEFLWLLVKYKNTSTFTFPRINRAPGDSMRESLESLVERQLGPNFNPHFVGNCPFAFDEIKDVRKVFYYRAHISIDATFGKIELEDTSPVSEFAWVPGAKLREFLSKQTFNVVKPVLM